VNGIRRAVATTGLLVTLGAAMALFAPTASASPYCGGYLAGGATCNGAARNLSGVSGTGLDHIVCVWADSLTRACSTGPGGGVAISYGSWAVRTPRIRNQGATTTWVQGETF
jgi:hypothetical protein